jgi:hypothetical protein
MLIVHFVKLRYGAIVRFVLLNFAFQALHEGRFKPQGHGLLFVSLFLIYINCMKSLSTLALELVLVVDVFHLKGFLRLVTTLVKQTLSILIDQVDIVI